MDYTKGMTGAEVRNALINAGVPLGIIRENLHRYPATTGIRNLYNTMMRNVK